MDFATFRSRNRLIANTGITEGLQVGFRQIATDTEIDLSKRVCARRDGRTTAKYSATLRRRASGSSRGPISIQFMQNGKIKFTQAIAARLCPVPQQRLLTNTTCRPPPFTGRRHRNRQSFQTSFRITLFDDLIRGKIIQSYVVDDRTSNKTRRHSTRLRRRPAR